MSDQTIREWRERYIVQQASRKPPRDTDIVIKGLSGDQVRYSYRAYREQPFLDRYPHVWNALLQAESALLNHFESPLTIKLELVHQDYGEDPTLRSTEMMTAWVITDEDFDSALDRLEQFERAWFLDHMDPVQELLLFDSNPRYFSPTRDQSTIAPH